MKRYISIIIDRIICFFTLLFAIFSIVLIPIGFCIKIAGKFIALQYLTHRFEDKYDLKEMYENAFDSIRHRSVSFRIKIRDLIMK